MNLIYLLVLMLAPVMLCVDEPPTVILQDLGTIIGSVLQSRENRDIHAFQGIPFAESPTAHRRFQPPVPKKWNGTLDATQAGIACAQPALVHLKRLKRSLWDVAESRVEAEDPEDCLLVSVYKPAEPSSNVLPVMVFVHGGSFIEGSASRFTPEYLLDRDVILVVPQYRLGPFGFLSLQNEVVPGNAGLMDIIESLKWVNKHITSFGGNPNQVTLFGQSAGAAISSYLMLSPLSSGLIHSVIANSGAAIARWAIDTEPVRHATKIAKLAGCRNETSEEQGRCLQNVPVSVLLNAFFMHSYVEQMKGGIALGGSLPVVSRAEEPAETKVVPVHPADKIVKGDYIHVPLMMGANRHEAMFVVNLIYDSLLKPGNLHEDEEYLKNVFPQYVVESCGYSDVSMVLTDMMEEKYFKYVALEDRGNFSEILPGVLDFFSTALFKAPGYRTVQLNSASSPANYWYSFNYQGRFHIPENGIDPGGLFSEGVAHSDEMIYLTPRVNETFNEFELKLSKMMVDWWVNFATSWDPNTPNTADLPEWPAYDMQNELYLDINIEPQKKKHYPTEYTAAIQDALKSSASSWVFVPLIVWLAWPLCTLL